MRSLPASRFHTFLAACSFLALASTASAAPINVTYALGATGQSIDVNIIGDIVGGSITVVMPNPGSGSRPATSGGPFGFLSFKLTGTAGNFTASPALLAGLAPTGSLSSTGRLNAAIQSFSFGAYLPSPFSSLRSGLAYVGFYGQPGGFVYGALVPYSREIINSSINQNKLFYVYGLSGQEVAVPEPGRSPLLLLGLVGLAVLATAGGGTALRRRRSGG